MTFIWKFNNTSETVDIAQSHVIQEKLRSTASYTPITERDYGSLLCWAKNSRGMQTEPCVFHVIPAGSYEFIFYSIPVRPSFIFKVRPIKPVRAVFSFKIKISLFYCQRVYAYSPMRSQILTRSSYTLIVTNQPYLLPLRP